MDTYHVPSIEPGVTGSDEPPASVVVELPPTLSFSGESERMTNHQNAPAATTTTAMIGIKTFFAMRNIVAYG
ncbi:MAG: hypothetical protein KDA95_04605 [Acidimicrobiales bacterium]|nr:hypothetical protein [Acidimicrobiales bacterium]